MRGKDDKLTRPHIGTLLGFAGSLAALDVSVFYSRLFLNVFIPSFIYHQDANVTLK